MEILQVNHHDRQSAALAATSGSPWGGGGAPHDQQSYVVCSCLSRQDMRRVRVACKSSAFCRLRARLTASLGTRRRCVAVLASSSVSGGLSATAVVLWLLLELEE